MYSLYKGGCVLGGGAGVRGSPSENFGKSRMQEKAIYHIFEAYSLNFYFSLISCLYFFSAIL